MVHYNVTLHTKSDNLFFKLHLWLTANFQQKLINSAVLLILGLEFACSLSGMIALLSTF